MLTPTRARALAFAFAAGIWATCTWLIQPRCYATSDFYAFWAAARLGDRRVYDPQAVEAVQQAQCSGVRGKRFIRPAFEALLLRPLGKAPYGVAYTIWFALNTAACLGFLYLSGRDAAQIIAAGLYLPLLWSFGLGQDVPLILVAFTAGARLLSAGQTFLAGIMLSAGLFKPNIFFVVPLILAARRQFRALGAMLLAGAALSCAAIPTAGADWPLRFVRAALANEAVISPNIVGMAGLIKWLGQPDWLRLLLAAIGAALALWWTRRQHLEGALYSAVAAGLVFGPRALIYDGAFLLPALLSRLSPAQTVAAGAALGLVVTPLRPLAETASPVWLWLSGTGAGPSRMSTGARRLDGRTPGMTQYLNGASRKASAPAEAPGRSFHESES